MLHSLCSRHYPCQGTFFESHYFPNEHGVSKFKFIVRSDVSVSFGTGALGKAFVCSRIEQTEKDNRQDCFSHIRQFLIETRKLNASAAARDEHSGRRNKDTWGIS